MNRSLTYMISLGITAGLLALVGCDFSSGGDSSFNTSRVNLNVNVSGVYRGQDTAGRAVSNPSAGNISQLVIQQSGNVLEVTDNQGSTYRGSVGIPTTLGDADGVIALGSELASYTVAWEGQDNVSARDVRFTGAIELVAVDDISNEEITETFTDDDVGTTTTTSGSGTDTTTSSSTTQDNILNNSTTTTGNLQVNESFNNTVNTDITNEQGQGGTQTGNNGQTETDLTSTTINTTRESIFDSTNDNQTDSSSENTANLSESVTVDTTDTVTSSTDQTDTRTTGVESERVVANQFQITANNTQLRLRGSWIEEAGTISSVDAISAGAGGILVIPIGQQADGN